MSNIVEFQKAVRQGVESAKAAGKKIVRRISGDGATCACPIRASIHYDAPEWGSKAPDMIQQASKQLGVTEDAVWSFIEGWDGYDRGWYRPGEYLTSQRKSEESPVVEEFYLLGQGMAEEYKPAETP